MILTYILTLILGACVGSFLNVLIYRTPNNLSIVKPASHCPNCKTNLRWCDNIPVFSWLFLGGKCRYCKTPISPRYIMVELLNTILWLLSVLLFWKISPLVSIMFALACSVLIVITFIDFEHKWIPDRFQIALLVLGIVLTIFDPITSYLDHILGFVVGAGVLGMFYGLGWLIYKKEALGIGDIKLMAVCGLILGWKCTLVALFVGAIVGAISCLIIRAVKKEEDVEYAFAPYLALGTIFAMFFGNQIISLYFSMF
ncbi:MAG: prepilin peptidase [Clostridia bacterium]|nr:prepilin peptidase [Clostridia bacterium]